MMLFSRKRNVYAWDGSGASPSSVFSNPEPDDCDVLGTVIKGALWEEILDPSSDIL